MVRGRSCAQCPQTLGRMPDYRGGDVSRGLGYETARCARFGSKWLCYWSLGKVEAPILTGGGHNPHAQVAGGRLRRAPYRRTPSATRGGGRARYRPMRWPQHRTRA
eukprot:scaffold207_cov409-Prasinococcus_capsulatus_cf.AAC.75